LTARWCVSCITSFSHVEPIKTKIMIWKWEQQVINTSCRGRYFCTFGFLEILIHLQKHRYQKLLELIVGELCEVAFLGNLAIFFYCYSGAAITVLGADYMCISVLRSDADSGHACTTEQSVCVTKTIFW